jgi:hypothetical protein
MSTPAFEIVGHWGDQTEIAQHIMYMAKTASKITFGKPKNKSFQKTCFN